MGPSIRVSPLPLDNHIVIPSSKENFKLYYFTIYPFFSSGIGKKAVIFYLIDITEEKQVRLRIRSESVS
jgi:hypothetical protein